MILYLYLIYIKYRECYISDKEVEAMKKIVKVGVNNCKLLFIRRRYALFLLCKWSIIIDAAYKWFKGIIPSVSDPG